MLDLSSFAPRSGTATRSHPLALTVLLLVFAAACAGGILMAAAPEARAQAALQATVQEPLTLSARSVDLRVEADLEEPWPAARVTVEVKGPGGLDGGEASLAGSIESDLGDVGPRLDVALTLGADLFAGPGAYQLSVTVRSGEDRQLTAETWLGRVEDTTRPVDLAAIWPVAAGPQRNPAGAFVSQTIQQSTTPDASSPGSLYSFYRAADRFPDWHFTLAVEPLFLTQLDALTGGFRELTDEEVEVDGDELVGSLASQALETFRRMASLDAVEVVPMPYASPSLPLLAGEGWPDGLEQMQLGKAELVQDLDLREDPEGAYPPGLELTSDVLSALSGASIDHVLASADLLEGLAEAPADAEKPVRVRDSDSNRVTLVPVNQELSASLRESWDEGRLFAALASELASGKRGPFVFAPPEDYGLAPGAFLERVGRALAANRWIRTRTLSEILRAHPPATRPIFLVRHGGAAEGFVAESYARRLRRGRAVAQDLLTATDSDRAPRDQLRLLLYQAESRFWFARGEDPAVANRGLAFLAAIEELVVQEFDKVDVVGDKSVIIMGEEGEVPVAVVNRTGYPLEVTVRVTGRGIELEDTPQLVELGPQENILRLPVRVSGASGSLDIELRAGDSLVESETVTVRAVSVGAALPWAVGVAALLAAGVVLLIQRSRR